MDIKSKKNIMDIYLLGICGVGMGGLATLLKDKGYRVRGADKNCHPPISDLLASYNIPIDFGYLPEHIAQKPDLIVIGNVIKKDNPLAIEVLNKKIPYTSFPEALSKLIIRNRTLIMVAGTHGKTTTSALLAWILEQAGLSPGFLIGGISKNMHKSAQIGTPPYFVLEGDEYDTAFFDKRPKFLHFSPKILILTALEYDHADIYPDLQSIKKAFRDLVEKLSSDSLLILNGDDKNLKEIISHATCKIIKYGSKEDVDFRITDRHIKKNRFRANIMMKGKSWATVSTNLKGEYNLWNITGACAALTQLGLTKEDILKGIMSFEGPKLRQELLYDKNNIQIYRDFAHHPTSVLKTLQSFKKLYPKKRLFSVIELRTNSNRRNVFQEEYVKALSYAEKIFIRPPDRIEDIPLEKRLNVEKLRLKLIAEGKEVTIEDNIDILTSKIIKNLSPGDVVIIMSNSTFGGLPQKLIGAIL